MTVVVFPRELQRWIWRDPQRITRADLPDILIVARAIVVKQADELATGERAVRFIKTRIAAFDLPDWPDCLNDPQLLAKIDTNKPDWQSLIGQICMFGQVLEQIRIGQHLVPSQTPGVFNDVIRWRTVASAANVYRITSRFLQQFVK